MRKSLKVNDSTHDISHGSRADVFWRSNPMFPYYKKLRPGIELPKLLKGQNNLEFLHQKFKVKALGFGNWVSIEDRHNYVNSLIISLYDLNKILQFNSNLGIDNLLSVTFGARGMSKALAHYEPGNKIINITRYSRGDEPKVLRFMSTGGVHSFTHEYGHFLDYFAGEYLDKDNDYFALTGGRLTTTKRLEAGGSIRMLMDKLLENLIWADYLKKYSTYYERLKRTVDNLPGLGDYFIRRNELFARAWEVYINYELESKGITNHFLSKPKYGREVYPTATEIKPLVPIFRELVAKIREKVA